MCMREIIRRKKIISEMTLLSNENGLNAGMQEVIEEWKERKDER